MKKISLLVFAFIHLTLSSQINNDFLSIGFESNSQYYLDDEKTGDFTEDNRFRSNNYLKVEYGFNAFSFGVQVEGYEPQALLNYSPSLDKTNIASYYAAYKYGKLEFTAGYYYEQFGSGLVLRFWEDRQIGINNALRGGRIKYNPTDFLNFTALYGQQRVGFKISDGQIFGFNSEIGLSEILKQDGYSLSLGFSYVGRTQKKAEGGFVDFNDLTSAFSSRIDFSKGNFYSNFEYISKSKDALVMFNQIRNAKEGNALQLNLGYSKKGLGIDATFRRMENMSFYSDRGATGNSFNESIINYTPGLTKQHDYLLTNIYVYQAQPQFNYQDENFVELGEIGGQIDIFYKIPKGSLLGGKYGTKIAFNTSYWAGLKGTVDPTNFNFETEFLGMGTKYFRDISIEIRKKISRKWSSISYFVDQFYSKRHIEDARGEVSATILVNEFMYKMGKGKSFRFEAQHLWSKDDRKNWVGGTLEYNASSKLGFYVNDI